MPAARKSESRGPNVGDRIRVYDNASMVDEPAEVIRVDNGVCVVHLWPDWVERCVLSDVHWFATEVEARAYGVRGAWSE